MGKIVRYTDEELRAMRERGQDKTDWARVDAMTDEELTANAASDPDSPELTEEDFARARPAREVLPEILGPEIAEQLLKRRGRPPKAATKEAITIRLSPEVLEYFRRQGRGWQTRIDEALKEWIEAHQE